MALHDGVPVQATSVRLAQQHLVIDRAFDERLAFFIGERPAEQIRLLLHELIDARPLDHDRLPLRRPEQPVGHEQEERERHEMDERLAPEHVPGTSEHRPVGTSQNRAPA